LDTLFSFCLFLHARPKWYEGGLVQKETQKGHFFVRCFPFAGAHGNRSCGLNALARYTTEKEGLPMIFLGKRPGLFFFLPEIKGFSPVFREAIHRAFRVSEAAWMVRPWKARRFQEKKNQPSVFCFFFWR
jgi:hypothetical protein